MVLPITYPSLLLTSQLAFTIWDVQGAGKAVPVGGTTMRLFTPKRCAKRDLLHANECVEPLSAVNSGFMFTETSRQIRSRKRSHLASFPSWHWMRWDGSSGSASEVDESVG